ncbi:Bifunctional dehydrogenase and ferrochelatase [Tulasnella sp. 427]|nr:Bifunctional dehydrogenase and ferrochelatase [Tulasnella sp. 427]
MADSTDSRSPFPPVNPGGSLIIAWQLKYKRVLLVGGGLVASGRLSHLLDADAVVTLIAPRSGLHPLVVHRVFEDDYAKHRITYLDRTFGGEADLDGADMVLTAIDDVELSRSICHMARARRIPVNVADVPPECDFYFGSMIRKGPLQVMVSTGGKGPKLANIIRRKMEDAVPDNVGEAIERVGELRAELRKRAPGVGGRLGQKRMDWMTQVCETWSLDELGQIDDATIQFLLDQGWDQKARVPSFEEVSRGLLRKSPSIVYHPPEPLLARYISPDFCVGVGLGLLVSLSLFMHRSR